MNKPLLVLLAVIVTAVAVAAPVVAIDRDVGATSVRCSMFKKFDKRTKTCVKR